MGDLVGTASLIELLWLVVTLYALVQSCIKLRRSIENRLALKKTHRLNGSSQRIVNGHIRSEVGRLLLYLGALATGIYAVGVPSSRTTINWFAVGLILILVYKTIDTHLSNKDTEYVVREIEQRRSRTDTTGDR